MGMSVRTARRRGAPLHMSHTSAEIFCWCSSQLYGWARGAKTHRNIPLRTPDMRLPLRMYCIYNFRERGYGANAPLVYRSHPFTDSRKRMKPLVIANYMSFFATFCSRRFQLSYSAVSRQLLLRGGGIRLAGYGALDKNIADGAMPIDGEGGSAACCCTISSVNWRWSSQALTWWPLSCLHG